MFGGALPPCAGNGAKGITVAHQAADFYIGEDILVPGVKAAANQLLHYLERTGSKSRLVCITLQHLS